MADNDRVLSEYTLVNLGNSGNSAGGIEMLVWSGLARSPAVEINIYAAKTQLSQLVRRVADGEEVVITRNGQPVARLVPVTQAAVARKLGTLAGAIRIGEDFDAPLPDEILDAFEGKA